MIRNILISMRPYQWAKNVLVFAALFFSLSFLNIQAIQLSVGAFIAFCLVSSGVYLMNDIRDKKADRLHPVKKNRPIASGNLPVSTALFVLFLLMGLGLVLSFIINQGLFIILIFYVLMNLAYSLGLKKVVLVDVMIIAMGFLLRAVAGAFAIGVAVSPWLFICTLMLALLLVFGKRRHELAMLQAEAGKHRKSLEQYSLPFLDGLMFISAGAAIVTYSLYTMAEEVVSRFGTQWLLATTPLAIYGVFRYLYLVYIKKDGGDPTKLMITDKPFLINALLWVLSVISILFFSKYSPV
ncbi:MAG: decaprenyl-phosphate phosphoribosyltransferase [Saprospiraceae bacterium]|nr:decaprenyl-phosphate phosphoribosyltransferase [Saprospiraceae bacterium]MCB9322263.1 decaprenyl-phosphate phosphoribosyltransferase [Lewinellaceae bacterium]